MAIPKPKPELPDQLWMDAVCSRVCVHIALDDQLTKVLYDLPHMDVPWTVCSECADELDRRLLDWQTRRTPQGIGRRL